MKKLALILIVGVLFPSLGLAWFALRSLRDQEIIVERQEAQVRQAQTDAFADRIRTQVLDLEREFESQVDNILNDADPRTEAIRFDETLRQRWSSAQVGFVVSLDGSLLAPAPYASNEARRFRTENGGFLTSREAAEVYPQQNAFKVEVGKKSEYKADVRKVVQNMLSPTETSGSALYEADSRRQEAPLEKSKQNKDVTLSLDDKNAAAPFDQARASQLAELAPQVASAPARTDGFDKAKEESSGNWSNSSRSKVVTRNVEPQQNFITNAAPVSRYAPEESEFRQIVQNGGRGGTLARFLQNKLTLLFWYRSPKDPQLIFGTQVKFDTILSRIGADPIFKELPSQPVAVAVLDDTGIPLVRWPADFKGNWKRPFVASEVGEVLPHWEVALLLLDNSSLTRSAQVFRLTFGSLILLLVGTLVLGGFWLFRDLRRQLLLARQKTDFVSNVSHELKTPLTSIRLFTELLSEGRVESPEQQREFLQIIATETSRLGRLIHNVLDFSRMERGEHRLNRSSFSLNALVEELLAQQRPGWEAHGLQLTTNLPPTPVEVTADRDAVAQILLNLLSNAEKYGGPARQIAVTLETQPHQVSVAVEDRGPGVPKGMEKKIFEKFVRADESLSSGISGSGLGLTLARELARAHGGDVVYAPRTGGGSSFTLTLPQ